MASTIKSNTVTNSTGSTLTLGESGTTVTLACGATQSGFGRTGTVDWCTTAKTSPLTAVSGNGYMINTCGGTVTVTLPSSPSGGDIVSLADYKSTWAVACKAVTVGRGGSKINGACDDVTLSTKGQSVTLVYIDGTQGWKSVQDSTADVTGAPSYITATGGTITTSGDYKIHTFTASGCFAVTSAPTPGNNTADYLVVAGGASGGGNGGGGGGGGGFRLSNDLCMSAPQTSPLANPTGLTLTASTTYPIAVGGGGSLTRPAYASRGNDGSVSTFSSITSAGGGGGGGNNTPPCTNVGKSGGSGGGSGVLNPTHTPSGGGGAGNTPPVSPAQGQNGGTGYSPYAAPYGGGGGGGAGAVGSPGAPGSAPGGAGSYGVSTGFAGCNGTTGPVTGARYFSGGGPGSTPIPGGDGGGGAGRNGNNGEADAGGTNTGGGGGGQGGYSNEVGAGGSGIVIIRYKYQ